MEQSEEEKKNQEGGKKYLGNGKKSNGAMEKNLTQEER